MKIIKLGILKFTLSGNDIQIGLATEIEDKIKRKKNKSKQEPQCFNQKNTH